MEKQTKILLGLGAVIAAYIILKPKKAVAQTDSAPEQRKVNTPWNTQDGYDPCANGFTYECAVSKGGGGVMGPLPKNETKDPIDPKFYDQNYFNSILPKGPCVCITAPCNC
jgi:hypothetical protein